MKYEGNTPVKTRDRVDLLIDGKIIHTASVVDALAAQFTVQWNNVTRFFFYEDRGLTWELAPIEEPVPSGTELEMFDAAMHTIVTEQEHTNEQESEQQEGQEQGDTSSEQGPLRLAQEASDAHEEPDCFTPVHWGLG